MTLALSFLESFDDERANNAAHPEYSRGYEAGLAAATAEQTSERRSELEGISQAILDMSFGYAEARAGLLQGLRRLFEEICTKFLPALENAALVSQLVDILVNTAQDNAAPAPKLTVHPIRAEKIQSLIDAGELPSIEIEIVDSIAEDGVWVSTPETNVVVDLSKATKLVNETLTLILNSAETPASIRK